MPLYVQPKRAKSDSRIVLIKLSACTLRQMETWRRYLNDYDEAMILLAIVAISSERLTRGDVEPELKDLATPVPTTRLARTNVSSIAAAIGLNRETVRRRVARMIESGLITRSKNGGLQVSPEAAEARLHAQEVTRLQLEHLRRAANQLLQDGVLVFEAH